MLFRKADPTTKPSVLLMSLVVGLLVACSKQSNDATPESILVEEPSVPQTAWSMTRGGPGLSGNIPAPLPGQMEIAWTFSAGQMISAEAAVLDGNVFVGTEDGLFFKLDLETGEEIWKFETEDAITAAPAVSGELVFLPSNDGQLYALSLETGEEVWKFGADDKISAAPVVVDSPKGDGQWVLMNGYDGTTRCLSTEDGALIWSYETEDFINGSPAVVDNQWVVFGGCDSQLHVIGLEDGNLVHKIPNDSQIVSSIATYKHMAYSGNYANQVVAFDVDLGMIAWVYEDRNLPFNNAPGVSDDMLFIGSNDKHLHAINQETGEVAWKFKTGARIESAPIVFDDGLIFGSGDGRLYALNLDSGEEIWRLDLGEGFIASPAYGYGALVIGGEDGTVFVLKESGL